MLGWFKKKFGRKQEEPVSGAVPAPEPEADEQALEVPPIGGDEKSTRPPVEDHPPEPAGPVAPAVGHDAGLRGEKTECLPPATDTAKVEGDVKDQAPLPQEAAEQPAEPEPVGREQAEAPSEEGDATRVEPVGPAEEELLEEVASATHDTAVEAAVDLEAEIESVVETASEEVLEPEADETKIPDEPEPGPLPASAEAVEEAPSPTATQEKPKSLFKRLHERLGKTRDSFVSRLDSLFLGKKQIDQDLFDQLEEILITADLGVGTAMELLDLARKRVKRDQLKDPQALKKVIRDRILEYLVQTDQPAELVMPEEGPFVIMVVGVNGVGKTTSIGKIAAKFVDSGQSVLLVAGDTFRAAAIDQLKIWGERAGVEVVAQKPGADPSSVVFDAMEYGKAHDFDVIIVDTAGRLHTSVNLMEELKKIRRVMAKKLEGAPHEVMLVIDATTGQNGISQARLFNEAVGVTGLTLTKLDGTAKGGIVVNICRECGIPVRFIGIGERMEDLRDFAPGEFVDALFGRPEAGSTTTPQR